MTIRLLPFTKEGGSPFNKVYMHLLKVDKAVSASGYKRLVCPDRNNLGGTCPFCETAKEAYKKMDAETDEVMKKKWKDVAYANKASEFWVVRCIERGHESEGVKFWMFPHNRKGDGIYDKIINIFNERGKKGKNIFDINSGKDLNIKVTLNALGKRAFQITDDDEYTPLTTNYELGMSWINDSKEWTDLWKAKGEDYMEIILAGGVPFWDKTTGKYVDKKEIDQRAEETAKNDVEQAFGLDLSGVEVDLNQIKMNQPTLTITKNTNNESSDSQVEDLPF
jgi:hypothetical protein